MTRSQGFWERRDWWVKQRPCHRGPQCWIWKFGLYPVNSGKPLQKPEQEEAKVSCVFSRSLWLRCPPSISSKQSVPPASKRCQEPVLPLSSPQPNLRQEVLLGFQGKCTSNEPREVNFQCQFSCLRQQQCCFKATDRRVGFLESVTKGDKCGQWEDSFTKSAFFRVGEDLEGQLAQPPLKQDSTTHPSLPSSSDRVLSIFSAQSFSSQAYYWFRPASVHSSLQRWQDAYWNPWFVSSPAWT